MLYLPFFACSESGINTHGLTPDAADSSSFSSQYEQVSWARRAGEENEVARKWSFVPWVESLKTNVSELYFQLTSFFFIVYKWLLFKFSVTAISFQNFSYFSCSLACIQNPPKKTLLFHLPCFAFFSVTFIFPWIIFYLLLRHSFGDLAASRAHTRHEYFSSQTTFYFRFILQIPLSQYY